MVFSSLILRHENYRAGRAYGVDGFLILSFLFLQRLFVVQTDSIETSSCLVSPAKVK